MNGVFVPIVEDPKEHNSDDNQILISVMDIEDPRDNVKPKEDMESVEKFLYEKEQELLKERE